jgi:DNA processing protein
MSTMPSRAEQAALLVLLRRAKQGWTAVADDVEATGSALRLLERSAPDQLPLFSDPDDLSALLEAANADIVAWERDGMSLLTLLDPEYPQQLLTVHQRPPLLFARGRLDPIDARGVAVVGTRTATERGLRQAADLADGLAARGVPVISGLAAGIDTAAHVAALGAGGRTVAVIGTGLRRAYPKQNTELQRRIGQEGLVLSQFLPDSPPTKTSFPMRNAVMSGYAAATVVVEAAGRSGARMQARLALEHGRPVFLLNTLLEHDWARDYASRPGATVVHDADDVLSRLDALADRSQDELVWS